MGPLTSKSNLSVVWLFGHPVGHSISPVMQNAAFRCRGLDIKYIARDVDPAGLAESVAELRAPRSRGANLTLPHKEAVISLLDDMEPEASRIGAVNTIVNCGGRLCGYNTDLGGFLSALRTALPAGPCGLDCLVLGAGGAARAVVAGLVKDGAKNVWVANRTTQRAEALCGAAAAWGDTVCAAIDLESVDSVVRTCDVIVNATSLGLPHSVKDLPIDVDTLHSGQVLVDLVYGTKPTALVQAARDKGLTAVDGKEMLIRQAALSYRLWTGMKAPLEIMRGSIDGC